MNVETTLCANWAQLRKRFTYFVSDLKRRPIWNFRIFWFRNCQFYWSVRIVDIPSRDNGHCISGSSAKYTLLLGTRMLKWRLRFSWWWLEWVLKNKKQKKTLTHVSAKPIRQRFFQFIIHQLQILDPMKLEDVNFQKVQSVPSLYWRYS